VKPRLLYVTNRYRTYDVMMYDMFATEFDLRVIWIGPSPDNEPLPPRLRERFPYWLVSDSRAILTPRDVRRNLRLFWLTVREGRDRDLIVTSTSDSWKARVVFAGARACGVPIALRKEKWRDRIKQPTGARGVYWRAQLRVTDYMERTAAAMLVGGQMQERYLLDRGLPQQQLVTFRNLHPDFAAYPSDRAEVERLRRIKGGRVGFLYLGRIIPRKGLAPLLRAFRRLGDGAVLFVVGAPIQVDDGRGTVSSTYFDECRSIAGDDPRIVFMPAVPPDRVQDVFAAADVFVHPHVAEVDGVDVHEGWGSVITESASMSKPIITTDRVASAYDIIDNGRNGFRVPTENLEDELYKAMRYFVDHPESIEKFGAVSRRRFIEFVDATPNIAGLNHIIERVRT